MLKTVDKELLEIDEEMNDVNKRKTQFFWRLIFYDRNVYFLELHSKGYKKKTVEGYRVMKIANVESDLEDKLLITTSKYRAFRTYKEFLNESFLEEIQDEPDDIAV